MAYTRATLQIFQREPAVDENVREPRVTIRRARSGKPTRAAVASVRSKELKTVGACVLAVLALAGCGGGDGTLPAAPADDPDMTTNEAPLSCEELRGVLMPVTDGLPAADILGRGIYSDTRTFADACARPGELDTRRGGARISGSNGAALPAGSLLYAGSLPSISSPDPVWDALRVRERQFVASVEVPSNAAVGVLLAVFETR
jgi:hypothetical protein